MLAGVDGSGKSSHARMLIEKLGRYRRVKYLWMRGKGRTLLSFPLLVLCRLLGITRVRVLKDGIRFSEYPFYAYKPLRFLWPWLQLVDSLIYTAILIHLPRVHSYDILIIDRSVVDTLVDVVADVHFPLGLQMLQTLFLSLLPKDSLVIVLDVAEEVAIGRKKDIPNKRYLSVRRRAYRFLAREYNWYVLSTEEEFDVAHNILLKIVADWLS